MEEEKLLLVICSWTSRADNRVIVGQGLGAHKKFTERWVRGVSAAFTQHRFDIADDIEFPFSIAKVGDSHPTKLNIVLRRDGDLCVHKDFVIKALELRATRAKYRLIRIRLSLGWLVSS
jgi:hypothetical protein